MNELSFVYDAIMVKQTSVSKPIVLFGAPASEIELWAGIPQKKSFEPDAAESSGFQRVENRKRLEQLRRFYLNDDNVVQNSLICALKKIPGSSVSFIARDGEAGAAGLGELKIEFPDLYNASFLVLFSLLRESLELRVGKFIGQIDTSALEALRARLFDSSSKDDSDGEISEYYSSDNDFSDSEAVILEETHLEEFLRDIVLRHELLKEIDSNISLSSDEFLGFDRSVLLSFLLPVTLVDGQHRLKGAILAAREKLESEDALNEIALRISSGENHDRVSKDLMKKFSRVLPISLLMEDDPKEQVFQFVVINQKATPIGRSLLGTIISTSLTSDEMESVSDRLKDSGILLEEARAITWAARNPNSPFYNLVERGIQADKKDLLQWSVMGSLIQIFKDLNGGSLFHNKVDYARRWRDKYLAESNIVSSSSAEDAYEEWRDLDGVWKDVFVTFWSKIRDIFAETQNEERYNYWGNTRRSNIFNKISLTILASDFFRYMCGARVSINSIEQLEEIIEDWLEDVSRQYFDRDWGLSGVKKDSTGIRAQWSELWANYRDNPEILPQARLYRQARK